jgi:hypothetical protein
MIKSVRMRWAGRDRSACWGLLENRGGKGYVNVGGRSILKYILIK